MCVTLVVHVACSRCERPAGWIIQFRGRKNIAVVINPTRDEHFSVAQQSSRMSSARSAHVPSRRKTASRGVEQLRRGLDPVGIAPSRQQHFSVAQECSRVGIASAYHIAECAESLARRIIQLRGRSDSDWHYAQSWNSDFEAIIIGGTRTLNGPQGHMPSIWKLPIPISLAMLPGSVTQAVSRSFRPSRRSRAPITVRN